MKAIVQDVYGTADVLELRDVATPEVGDDEALVRVHAAGVDRGVWHLMTGLPYLVRIAGVGLRRPKTKVRGFDVAGTVEAVGTRVTRFRPGDEVMGTCDGSFAEYAAAPEVKLAPKPAGLTFEQAAAVPVSGSTALQAVRDQGRIHDGDRVLILGASGGVGTFAVQLAKWLEADVTAVCSTAKVELVHSLGADRVVDYKCDDFTRLGIRHDVMIDVAGSRPFRQFARVLTPNAIVVLTGGPMNTGLGPLPHFFGTKLSGRIRKQHVVSFLAKIEQDDLALMAELLESGKVKSVVEQTYPLSEVPAALRHLGTGHARGKIVITV